MTTSVLQFGTQIARDLHDSSANGKTVVQDLKTLRDLMDLLIENPPSGIRMLPTTCMRLADYLEMSIDLITIDSVNDTRDGFRAFLEARKYKENAIRSYVN